VCNNKWGLLHSVLRWPYESYIEFKDHPYLVDESLWVPLKDPL